MLKAFAVAAALVACTTVAGAQATGTNKSSAKPTTQGMTAKRHKKVRKADQAELQKEAKIPEATARATALAQVPNGTVKASELERENGKLIYSYDITVPGKTGTEEVNVDAKLYETPKSEKKEAVKEAKEKKTK